MTDEAAVPSAIYQRRSIEETRALYRDWADQYDADVAASGYATPKRVAEALFAVAPDPDTAILDFGCGTGLSGKALAALGYATIDGTDLSPEMMARAGELGLYRRLYPTDPSAPPAAPGTYGAIVAVGVVSIGAAPPQTLDLLIDALGPGGLLVFSFNEPTLADPDFEAVLQAALERGAVEQLARENGPHLPAKDMSADVITLRRS